MITQILILMLVLVSIVLLYHEYLHYKEMKKIKRINDALTSLILVLAEQDVINIVKE